MDVEDDGHLDLLAAVLLAFAALGCLVALLFIIGEGLEQPLRPFFYSPSETQAISTNESGLASSLPPLVPVNNPEVTVAALDQDLDNNGNLDGILDPWIGVGFSPPIATANRSEVAVGVLDNDLDHDGNPDGLADYLGAVTVLSALAALVSGSVLLALYNSPKPSFVCQLVLERPG